MGSAVVRHAQGVVLPGSASQAPGRPHADVPACLDPSDSPTCAAGAQDLEDRSRGLARQDVARDLSFFDLIKQRCAPGPSTRIAERLTAPCAPAPAAQGGMAQWLAAQLDAEAGVLGTASQAASAGMRSRSNPVRNACRAWCQLLTATHAPAG